MTESVKYQPVVILGAGRSGTNLLRDGLTQFSKVATWPCDEVNYLWRCGWKSHPTDEFTRDMATEPCRRKIVAGFDWVADRYGAKWVVEKTCANTLRVGFVDEILPTAKFVHITRNGYDVTASAMKRWTAAVEPLYLARKARFVPAMDLPYYAARFIGARIRRLRDKERSLPTWGPRFDGMSELRAHQPLSVVCATQWRRCVEAAAEQLRTIPRDRVISINYESLIAEPQRTLGVVVDFLGIPRDESLLTDFSNSIRPGSVGAGVRSLSTADYQAVRPVIEACNLTMKAA